MTFEPGTTLILGGARSGKSLFAENWVNASSLRKIYLATSEPLDDEMTSRIAHHQARRGDDWELVEEPLNLVEALSKSAQKDTCILVDCLTLWLTNLMVHDQDIADAFGEFSNWLATTGKSDVNVVLVSNEVGQGIVPMEKMAREFRDHAGRLHQDIAAIANHVWFVTAGLPQRLK